MVEINGKVEAISHTERPEAWVICPDQRHLWIYRPGGVAELRSGRFQAALLSGAEIDLDAILGE